MTKFRKSLLIFGILVLIIGVALGTFVVLSLTGSLKAEQIALEFTVDDAQKEYDGKTLKATSYSITDGYLAEGHMPVISFTGEQTDAGNSVSGLDVKIVDEKGFDVTDEYKIKVNGGILSVAPCSVQIKLTAQNIIYDGTAVDIGNGYVITGGGLARGHSVSLSISDEWVNNAGKIIAGKTLNATDIELIITDGGGRNVTGNYIISLAGKVNIVKRPLVISPVSAEKTYDGKPLECKQYKTESGSLASGHYIIPKFEAKDGTSARVVNANANNPLEITVKAAVYDMNGDDVTDNYDLRSISGYLTVNKANLTISAKSGTWVYDGKEHSLSDDNEPDMAVGLASGEQVTVTYRGKVTDVSKVDNDIDEYTIENGKSENYEVTIKKGTLEVTKAPLTVTLKSIEKEYGDPFDVKADNIYSVSSTIDNLKLQFSEDNYLNKLFEGITEIGNSTYTISDFKIYDGADEVTDKFNITVAAGNIQIKRRKVNLKTSETLIKDYDGNFVFKAGNGIAFDKPLVDGHRFESVTCAPISSKDVGQTVGSSILSFTLVDAHGNNALGYYDIESSSGLQVNIKINAKSLEISSEACEKEYDGLPLEGGELSYGLLAAGDRLVSKTVSITNVGEEKNLPEYTIYNSNNDDVTDFYDINSDKCGLLKITPKPVTVYIDSEIEYVRGGMSSQTLFKNIRCEELSVNCFGLSIEGVLECGGSYEVTEFYWNDGGTVDNKNYKIVEGNKKFTIVKIKRSASINSDIAYKTYDTKPIETLELNLINIDEVPTEEQSNLEFVSSNLVGIVDAGEYDAVVVYESDIEILTVTGKYTVKPLNVTITSSEQRAIYNGLAFKPNVSALTVNSPIGQEVFAVKSCVTNDVINAGTHSLSIIYADLVFKETGETVKESNVKVDVHNSSFSVIIEKRVLNITLSPINGYPITPNLTSLINVSNLADGHRLVWTDAEEIVTFAGSYTEFHKEFAAIICGEGNVITEQNNVSANYEILPEIIQGVVTGIE